MMRPSWNGIYQAVGILTCCVFSAGLFGFVLAGTTSRYLQDDYCYSFALRGENFFLEQYSSYMHQTAYSANRFSLTLGMGLSELAGPGNVPVLPGLMLTGWVVGLYALIRRLSSRTIAARFDRLEAFAAAEALALFTLSMAPNWIQSFAWRPGMFPYFAPIVSGTYLVLWMLIAGAAGRWRPAWLCGVFLLAALTGGFSETAACVELASLAIFLGAACFWKNGRRPLCLPAGIALLGCIAAMALLIASPVNAARLRMNYGAAASLPATILQSLNGAVYFYISTAYRPVLPYASALLFFGLVGLIHAARHEQPPLSWKPLVAGLLAAVLIAYLLTAAAMAPSFYAESSYPGNRALIIPRFASILLAAAAGFLTGRFLGGWGNGRRFAMAAVLAGIAIVFIDAMWLAVRTSYFLPPAYPDMRSYLKAHLEFGILVTASSAIFFGLIFFKYKRRATLALLVLAYLIQPGLMGARIFREYPVLQQRAVLWDGREAQILQARDRGESDLTVRPLDSLAGLTDLSEEKRYWVNRCVAYYYGLKWIRASGAALNSERFETP